MALSVQKLPVAALSRPENAAGTQRLASVPHRRPLGNEKVARLRVRCQLAQGQAPTQSSDRASLEASFEKSQSTVKPLKILVAGAGIGGLVFALAAKKRGIHVEVRVGTDAKKAFFFRNKQP